MDQVELFGLKGTHVGITGASGGIGLATAELFYKLGARITAHGNTNTTALEELRVRMQGHAGQLNIVAADATKEEDVVRFYEESRSKFGAPDVLVGI